MFGAARVRARVDQLLARFEAGGRPGASATVDDGLDRLELAVDRHFASLASSRLVADRLVSALDVIPQGIVLADAEGAVVFRNRAAAAFSTARHSEALVESAIRELIGTAVMGGSATRTLELYGPPRRALQLRSVPLRGGEAAVEAAGGEQPPAGAFLVVEDISERQRLDAVRRDFVANISHELKTPIGALGLLAETLVEEPDPEVARRLAARMQREADRVARTIDDLLALSQIEGGELPEREPVPVRHVLAEAVDRTRPAADLGGVKLVFHEPDLSLTVLGDRRQLVSAVANLCDNAVKYSDEGAEVSVAAHLDGDTVRLEVADQGIGIPARDLERVFERFYRVDRARSRETGGTGLGLAIVRHVAHNHAGDVTVSSREGVGSTFALTLPAYFPDEDQP